MANSSKKSSKNNKSSVKTSKKSEITKTKKTNDADKIKNTNNGDKTKKTKNKKDKHLIGKKEFIFNFLSLTFLIGIGIYFGYRSLYYYSKQNIKLVEDAKTLNGTIINNIDVVQNDDTGLHRDNDGYYYKGNVENNYVFFANKYYRIIRINNDGSVKMISEDLAGSFMYGESVDYDTSNLKNWLSNSDESIPGVYYTSLPSPEFFLDKTTYSIDILNEGKIDNAKDKKEDYVTTLTVYDYILANGKNSYLNTGKIFFILGLQDESIIYVDEDGSIQMCDSLDGYGIRPVITLKANSLINGGDGTKDNPYTINQGDNKNYVDSYIKLGDDVWKVSSDLNGVLKLYLCGYINTNGEELIRNYGEETSLFDITDKKSLAFYLNNDYYNSLTYSSLILDSEFYLGEISDDAGYYFTNIFNDKINCKVGLLNIFDYVSYNDLNDYFNLNRTSSIGSIQYTPMSSGLLGEASVTDLKHVVPVISINKDVIKRGSGLINDPYIVE